MSTADDRFAPPRFRRRPAIVVVIVCFLLLPMLAAAGLYIAGPSLLAPQGGIPSYEPPDPVQVGALATDLLLTITSLNRGQVTSITLSQSHFEQLLGVLLLVMGDAGRAVPQPGVPGSPIPIAWLTLAPGAIQVRGVIVTPLYAGLGARFGGIPIHFEARLQPVLLGNLLNVSVTEVQLGRLRVPPNWVLRWLEPRVIHDAMRVDPRGAAFLLRLPPFVEEPTTGRQYVLQALRVEQGQLSGTIRRIK